MIGKKKMLGMVCCFIMFMLFSVTAHAEYHYNGRTVAEGETFTDNNFQLLSSYNPTFTNNGTVVVTDGLLVDAKFINNGILKYSGSDSNDFFLTKFVIGESGTFTNNGTITINGSNTLLFQGTFVNKGTLVISDIKNVTPDGLQNDGIIVYEEDVNPALITKLLDKNTAQGKVMSREEYETTGRPSECTIEYDLSGGNWKQTPSDAIFSYPVNDKGFYTIGKDAPFDTLNDNVVREHYWLKGWKCVEENTAPSLNLDILTSWNSKITLQAVWEPERYYVFYHLDGGNFPDDVENPKVEADVSGNLYTLFNVESDDFTLPEPEKSGYRFKGWGLGGTAEVYPSVTIKKGTAGNAAYTAMWEARGSTPYNVEVYYMDEKGNYSGNADKTYTEAGMTGQAAEKTGAEITYKREGFSFDAERSTNRGTISADGSLTLSLYYKRSQHKIIFKNYDGELIKEYNGYYGTQTECPEPPSYTPQDGYTYTFNGWSDETGSDFGITSPGKVREDKTYYAAFEKKATFCTISLKDLTGFKEAESVPKTIRLNKGESFELKLNLADEKYYVGTKGWTYTFSQLGVVYSDEPGGLIRGEEYSYTIDENKRTVVISIPSVTKNLDITVCAQYHEEHDFAAKDDTVLKEADCAKKGSVRHFCYKCGKTAEAETAKNPANHTALVKIKAKKATDKKEGNIEYYYCSGCKKYFSDKAGKKEIALKDTVIKKLKKKPEKTEKKTNSTTPKNPILINNKAKAAMSGSKIKVSWSRIKEAQGYNIYAAKCGSKFKLVKTVKGSKKVSRTISKIGKTKISSKGTYKVQVKAYRVVKGKKKIIATSKTFHLVGKNRKGYTNAKSIKVTKANITLKKGKTKKIKAKIVKQNKKKKLLSKKHTAVYRYYSTNKKVATVSKSGTVKAKGKGSCTVYVMAANGTKKAVKVKVK